MSKWGLIVRSRPKQDKPETCAKKSHLMCLLKK